MMFGYDKIEEDARFCGVDDAMTAGYAPLLSDQSDQR